MLIQVLISELGEGRTELVDEGHSGSLREDISRGQEESTLRQKTSTRKGGLSISTIHPADQ